jgi:hypothetical protein
MYITKKFVESAGGPRSPMVRHAMVQAGDRDPTEIRVRIGHLYLYISPSFGVFRELRA